MDSKKRTVLIVDDEFRIGMLIKNLVHWTEMNMVCLDVLDNGEKAFDAIREKQPDIVVTDIRMPKVDGLDLIKMTLDYNMDVSFIVISGYKEFEYAHRALSYGVENYILKPVNEKELNDALLKVVEKLDKGDSLILQHNELKKSAKESNKIIKREFLNSIINQDNDIYTAEKNSLDFSGEFFRGIDIKLDYINSLQMDIKQDKMVLAKVEEIMEEILGGETEEFLISDRDSLHIYCLMNYADIKSRKILECISTMLTQIKDYLMGFDQYEATIGVGNEKTTMKESRDSLRESYCAVCNRMRYGTGRLIYSNEEMDEDTTELKKRLEDIKTPLYSGIDTYSGESVITAVDYLLDESLIKPNTDMQMYYSAAEKVS